jgi:uncharacterized membrane protein
MSDQLDERLDRFERTLSELRVELTALQDLVRKARPSDRAPEAPQALPPPRPGPRPERVSARVPKVPLRPRLGAVLGARVLALVGGVVTLLGVVLLFALAVNRGWVGPWARCGIGALASALVFTGGIWLRRRYGETYSSLAAVGAGIGGAFATLIAAAALYDLLPPVLALAMAGAIAAVALVTAIAWSAQLVAALGLVGAMLVPLGVLIDRDLTVLGTSFVAIVLVAAGIVALWRRWSWLLVAAVIASGGQIAVLVWQSAPGSTSVIALATVFWLAYLGLAIGRDLRTGAAVEQLAASLVLLSAAFATGSAVHLFEHLAEGVTLLVVAATYGAASAAFLVRGTRRDLSSLLWAVALAVAAVSAADLLSGSVLAVAWAAESAILAWLAVRVREPRFQLGALGYLALAAVHAVAVEAPPSRLFVASEHPAAGALSVVAAAFAALVCAEYASPRTTADRPATGAFAVLQPLFAWIATRQRALRDVLLWTVGILATYAVSLGLLELFVLGDLFSWGAVPVSGLWALASGTLLVVGARRCSPQLRRGGEITLGLTLAKVFVYDLGSLRAPVGDYSALATGTIVLLAGYLYGRERQGRGAGGAAITAILASAVLLVTATVGLLPGVAEAAVLLGLGTCYAGLAASVYRGRRDLATWLWATGLVIVLLGWGGLLGGTPRTVAFAGTASIVAAFARRTGDRRLRLGAAGTIVLALLRAVVLAAPPRDLFVVGAHPGRGVVALAAVALASAGFAVASRTARERKPKRPRRALVAYRVDRAARQSAPWVAGVLAVDAVSLAILQVFQWAGPGSVQLEFQHGHTAVSAFWGLLGLVALYLGLSRRSPRLRRAGFGIFALSLAKIFLYDLSQLSSITRALSFLAVGGVLLLGGFFYQRLSAQLESIMRDDLSEA